MTIDDFKLNLGVSPGATWQLYKSDGKAVDNTLTDHDVLIVTALDRITKQTYTLNYKSSDTNIKTLTVKGVNATQGQDENSYNVVFPKGTDLSAIIAADFQVEPESKDSTIVVNGLNKVSDNLWQVRVTSDEGFCVYNINLSVANS